MYGLVLTMTILICDDDICARRRINDRVRHYFERLGIECELRSFSDGRELLQVYDRDAQVRDCDIMFLDINMPRLNGMETAKAIRRRGCKAELIFLTACKEYVFSCFCLNTFRYLLKPLQEDLLKEALDAFCRKKTEEDRLLYLKFGDQNYSIRSQEIVYIEVMRGKIWIYTDTDCFRWSGTLNALEEMLPCPPFYRVHRSFLINLRKVEGYNPQFVTLSGKKILISRYRYHGFCEAYRSCVQTEQDK